LAEAAIFPQSLNEVLDLLELTGFQAPRTGWF
jgi:hypothetical protein